MYSISEALALIEKYESGGRNIPNYINDPLHTASGYYQITNTNWHNFAGLAGINLAKYPTAMSAPKQLQAKVAAIMYERRGFLDWSPFNARLRAAIARGERILSGNSSEEKPKTPDVLTPIIPAKSDVNLRKVFLLAVGFFLIVLSFGVMKR